MQDKEFEQTLKELKASIGDFLIQFQEIGHCSDTELRSIYSAYTKADITGAAVDYAELGMVFAGMINKEFENEVKRMME